MAIDLHEGARHPPVGEEASARADGDRRAHARSAVVGADELRAHAGVGIERDHHMNSGRALLSDHQDLRVDGVVRDVEDQTRIRGARADGRRGDVEPITGRRVELDDAIAARDVDDLCLPPRDARTRDRGPRADRWIRDQGPRARDRVDSKDAGIPAVDHQQAAVLVERHVGGDRREVRPRSDAGARDLRLVAGRAVDESDRGGGGTRSRAARIPEDVRIPWIQGDRGERVAHDGRTVGLGDERGGEVGTRRHDPRQLRGLIEAQQAVQGR